MYPIQKFLFLYFNWVKIIKPFEDYSAAIETYERSLKRFPDSLYKGELYLNLSYCYRKLGNLQKADYYKNLLLHKFEKSKYTQLVIHPESMDPSKKDTAATKDMRKFITCLLKVILKKR